jgi:hypothetical protein
MDEYLDDYNFSPMSETDYDSDGEITKRDEGTDEDWEEWSANVITPGWLEEDMAEGP